MFTLILVIALGVYGYISITNTADIIEESVYEANYNQTEVLAEMIEDNFANLEASMENLADMAGLVADDELEDLLQQSAAEEPIIADLAYLDENFEPITYTGEN